MKEYSHYHATIFVPSDVAETIEAARREWDPIMAGQISAHVTLVYPQEATDTQLLIARVRAASTVTAPFRLRLGTVSCFEQPEGGIYISVADVDGVYHRLRREIVSVPFHPIPFPPHVTLIHPRTSSRGRDFWERGGFSPPKLEFSVDQAAITAFDGTNWVTIEKCALRGDTQ